MAKCEQCNNEYESKRSTSKYCSTQCRKLAFQDKDAKARNAKNENAKDNTIGTVNPPPPIFMITPEGPKSEVPTNYGLEDCACKDCQLNRVSGNKRLVNHGAYKDADQLADNEINRVALPGDSDYLTHNTTEYCAKCGGELPKLSKPRTRPGKCYPCVMGKVEAIA